jgi:hypothetical protein
MVRLEADSRTRGLECPDRRHVAEQEGQNGQIEGRDQDRKVEMVTLKAQSRTGGSGRSN